MSTGKSVLEVPVRQYSNHQDYLETRDVFVSHDKELYALSRKKG